MGEYPFLWILLCVLVSAALVWIHYLAQRPAKPFHWPLAVLRFFALLGILLLLADVKIRKRSSEIRKHELIVLTDNSRSVRFKGADTSLLSFRNALIQDSELQDRFTISPYNFGGEANRSDTLDFNAEATDIAGSLEGIRSALKQREATVVLLSDGNDNTGVDISGITDQGPVIYPVIFGDTTKYRDIRIDRIDINRFAFLGNSFPVEVLYSYTGTTAASSELVIRDNGRVVARKTVTFASGAESRQEEFYIDALEVGVHRISAGLQALPEERNTRNNTRTAGLEVLDESLEIRIVSSDNHPDLGALKRSLLRNPQRRCEIMTPSEALRTLQDIDLLIFFNPNRQFRELYSAIANRSIPLFTITGPGTSWTFLNQAQSSFGLEEQGPPEDLFPMRNASFDYFDNNSWEVAEYPPLSGLLGLYSIYEPHQVLLEQRIRGISLDQPLLALLEGEPREAVLFGSGLWQWSLGEYRNTGSTLEFDQALSRIVLFLAASAAEQRLTLDYEPIYDGIQGARIRARFVDEAYDFDEQAQLRIRLQDSIGQDLPVRPMSLRTGYFEFDLAAIPPGEYNFTVEAVGTSYSASGNFVLRAFDLEARQTSSDLDLMNQLGQRTGGRLFFPQSFTALRDSLLGADQFRPIEKSQVKVVSLIDYWWLLPLIIALLAGEWFTRKYYGLI